MRKFLLGLGAQRAGTTTIHNYLNKFDLVEPPFIKEMHIWDALEIKECSKWRENIQTFPNSIFVANKAISIRKNHPGFFDHCARYVVFGRKNFNLLDKKNQKQILKFGYFFKNIYLFGLICRLYLLLFGKIYKNNFNFFNYTLIRAALFSSIIKGRLFR